MKTGKSEASRQKNREIKEFKKLDVELKEIEFREIQETDLNAQKMSEADFKRLVENIRHDGCLTSTPLICVDENGNYTCISGHHRIRAAMIAGIKSSPCLVLKDIDESTRIRLQLSHNDIHGNPDDAIVALLLERLNDSDMGLVNAELISEVEKIGKEVNVTVPEFRYINICLSDQSRNDLVDMIMSLEKSDAENWLITQEQYSDVKDLLTYAFEHGFKTPGQAFGKFLDIIKENKDLISRK